MPFIFGADFLYASSFAQFVHALPLAVVLLLLLLVLSSSIAVPNEVIADFPRVTVSCSVSLFALGLSMSTIPLQRVEDRAVTGYWKRVTLFPFT